MRRFLGNLEERGSAPVKIIAILSVIIIVVFAIFQALVFAGIRQEHKAFINAVELRIQALSTKSMPETQEVLSRDIYAMLDQMEARYEPHHVQVQLGNTSSSLNVQVWYSLPGKDLLLPGAKQLYAQIQQDDVPPQLVQAPLAETKTLANKAEKGKVRYEEQNSPEHFEKAAFMIKDWIREERFAEVEDFILFHLKNRTHTRNGYFYAESVLYNAFEGIDDFEDSSDLLPKLNLWIEQIPSSSLAFTIRAKYYYGLSWKARGRGWASQVSQEGRKLMREYLKRMVQDIESAFRLEPENPLAAVLMTDAARPLNLDEEILERYFQLAIAYEPDFCQAYADKVAFLAPKWGGSIEAMYAFAKQTFENAPRGSALPKILADAHMEIASHVTKNAEQYYNMPEVRTEMHEIYQRLVEDFPHSAHWPSEYAIYLRTSGQLDEAQRFHDLALKRDPKAFVTYYERGRFFHYYRKNSSRALQEYEKALELRPYSRNVLSRKAAILFKQKRLSKALDIYSKLVDLEPYNYENYYYRANVYAKKQKCRDAIKDYTKAIELYPRHERSYKRRAACYERLGMTKEQQSDLRMVETLSRES